VNGDSFASRVAASLVTVAGQPQWAWPDAASCDAATVALARDPGARAAARADLLEAREGSPLFDARRFARAFEERIEALARDFRPRGS
jgi:protein O-GlcNAc transferase